MESQGFWDCEVIWARCRVGFWAYIYLECVINYQVAALPSLNDNLQEVLPTNVNMNVD